MKNFNKLKQFISESNDLCFLTQDGVVSDIQFIDNDNELRFYIPLCPDYSFEINENNERIHDFSGMENGRGIVYEKFIKNVQPMFDYLRRNNIKYYAYFLMANVEVVDQTILNKLKINAKQFLKNCSESAVKVDEDLKTRQISGKCIGMEEFFNSKQYDFHKLEIQNLQKVRDGEVDIRFRDHVLGLRKDLYKFWFGIPDEECTTRAYKDIGMYATFAEQPDISTGIILCADSEILSCSYNALKKDPKTHTPVIYVKGNY